MPDNTSAIQVADWLADDWKGLQEDPTFVAEELVLDVAVQIAEAMEGAGLNTQKELADRLDISESAVSQLLSGDQNISINRLVEVALTLGKIVEVDLVDREVPIVESVSTKTKRVDVSDKGQNGGKPGTSPWEKATGGGWTKQSKGQPEATVCVRGTRLEPEAGTDDLA